MDSETFELVERLKCRKKRSWTKRHQAKKFAGKATKHRDRVFTHYKCPYCGNYHLTTRPKIRAGD